MCKHRSTVLTVSLKQHTNKHNQIWIEHFCSFLIEVSKLIIINNDNLRHSWSLVFRNNGRFYTTVALSIWTNLGKHFVVRLDMRLKYKDGHKTHYVSRRATSVVGRSRRITKDSSSRRIMRLSLVPVFILGTHKQTNYKMFAQFRTDG